MLLAWFDYWNLPDPMRWAIALWLFAFGACAGSFMNVVIWRLPLGRSVIYPGSRCPHCGHAVRSYDNIPILNWLILRGRCRDCGAPISWRYPAVETFVAALFLLIAFLEPLREGRNLPRFPEATPYNPSGLILLWVFYFEQMLLLCTLICAAFMWFDGNRPVERLFAPLGMVALLAPLVAPGLRPEQWVEGWLPVSPRLAVATESVIGLLFAGVVAAVTAATVYPRHRHGPSDRDAPLNPERGASAAGALPAEPPAIRISGNHPFLPAMWDLAGCLLVFGIPASTRIAAAASLLGLLAAAGSRILPVINQVPWTGWLVGSAVLQIAFWKETVSWLPSVPYGRPWLVVPAAVVVTVIFLYLTRILRRAQPEYVPGWNRNWPDQRASRSVDKSQPHHDQNHKLPTSVQAIVNSPSYKLAELDTDFLQRSELRPVRLQLELLKPEMAFAERGIHSTIVVFGGTQILEQAQAEQRLAEARAAVAAAPGDAQWLRRVARLERLLAKAPFYDSAREFARIVSAACQQNPECDYVIVTGGGPGVMEAANRGAHDIAAKSVGLNITLPQEQVPNPYITPGLCFQFHYFALRKMHFLLRARALVVFPGGFGTLDELFEVLTLRQTNRMQAIPVILFGREYWDRALDFQFLADEGVIADEHLQLIQYAETPQQAWDIIRRFHNSAGDG